ncbi:dihydroxyacetone kinase phosphoryl donor subunit DhaM [Actinomycetaceae bacterium MB13-C1-2]|nr:dihydroxyacetone kinase phosphoryl donor subunit DhaM [Actinomycetaceae bacterium MB13-C1-2]
MGDTAPSRVSLVVVSHSKLIADGTRELALAMAPNVHIGAAGGDPTGGLGSSFDLIELEVARALESSGERGVVVLTDLGSATLTVDSVIEFATEPDLIRYVPGPLVEGAVAAAVVAEGGGDLDRVASAVVEAAQSMCRELSSSVPTVASTASQAGEVVEVKAIVADKAGLHARPAAKIATLAAGFDAEVWIDEADCASAMELMAAGMEFGQEVTVRAQGPDALRAAREIADGINAGFDEQV